MAVITMSRTEIDRMSVLQDLAANRIKVTEAATLMSLGRRQVFRLAKAYAQRGPEARPAEQSRLLRGFTRCGHWHHQGALPGFWPDAGGGEARGAAWDSPCVRDGSSMDDCGGSMEGSPGPAEACSSAAVSPRLPGRTDPNRRFGTLVVRGSGATMHPARLRRRCHQPADASAVCREREHLRLFYSDTGVSGALRQAGGVLFRQARCVSGQQQGCDRR